MLLIVQLMISHQLIAEDNETIFYEITGAPEHIKDNIQIYLSHKNYDCMALLSEVSQQRKDLISQTELAVQPFGYFNSMVTITKGLDSQCKPLKLSIELGNLTVIKNSTIEVVGGDEAFKKLLTSHQLQVEQPLIQSRYESLKNQLLQLANDRLYLDAEFTKQRIVVYPETNTAELQLMFDTGQRYQISEVKLSPYHKDNPNNYLDPVFIDRLITIKPQQYITYNDLYQLQQKLNSYGYFEQVLIEIEEQAKADNGVPLNIKLAPANKFDYAVGLGFSTDAGVKASFKYNNHRINNKGHQYSSQLNLSELSNELTGVYKMPSKSKPASEWFSWQLGYRDEKTDLVDSQTSKLGVSQTRIKHNRWQNINFIDLLHEKFDTGEGAEESLLLVPGVSWSITQADQLPRPLRGYKLQAEIKGASEDVFSDASFVQLTLQGKYIQSVSDRNRLIYRAQIGTTASSDFDDLPTTYRFFAGGDQNIRGYDYESISPVNNDGDLIGGKHQLVGSVEFEHQFAPQWAVAAFTDFGDAFSDDFDFKYSVGTGLRWFSPIGPIRLDLGVPLNQEGHDFRLHVTIGPDL